MICKNCATGADVVTRLKEMSKEDYTGQNDYIRQDFKHVSQILHNQCKGCDCQHAIELPKD